MALPNSGIPIGVWSGSDAADSLRKAVEESNAQAVRRSDEAELAAFASAGPSQPVTGSSRIERRDRLFSELGFLIRPIQDLLAAPTPSTAQIAQVRAQFKPEHKALGQQVVNFCRESERFHYDVEYGRYKHAVWRFATLLDDLQASRDLATARRAFDVARTATEAAIRGIPADDPDAIFPAASPFTTYLRLRALCVAATRRIDLFDPYLDASPFHLYLAEVAPNVPITLVTSATVMGPPTPKDVQRRDRIVAVSTVMAGERPTTYRLLVMTQQHDRHLRIDDTIFVLGGSVKDAGVKAPYTIVATDSTTGLHEVLDGEIAGAAEWFGPGASKHRTG